MKKFILQVYEDYCDKINKDDSKPVSDIEYILEQDHWLS